MSKRRLILVILGLLILIALVLSNFGRNLPFLSFGPPVFTAEIPESRPPRLDRKQLERFAGQSMDTILETLLAERAEEKKAEASGGDGDPESRGPTNAELLLASLPDAPLPFPDDAAPADGERLRAFITRMEPEEGARPTREERWQFNLALAALDVEPEQVPESLRLDTQPAPESDTFDIRLAPWEHGVRGPFAIGDFDDDGGREIVTEGGGAAFRFDAEGGAERLDWFDEIVPGEGLFPADYDGDGDLDLFLTRRDGLPDSLLRNEGGGRFADVTVEAGLLAFGDTATAAWLDYDGDGRLDLMVGSHDHPLELYRQAGDGSFQPLAWDLGLWVPRGVAHIEAADFSGDGLPDFFLGIDGLGDRLCVTRPAETPNQWRFPDVAAQADVAVAGEKTAALFLDFDNDGRRDLLLGHAAEASPSEAESPSPGDPEASSADDASPAPSREATERPEKATGLRLYRNEGGENFREVTAAAGLDGVPAATALGAGDLDNDGFLDLFVGTGPLAINRVFWNRGGVSFREISVVSRGSYLDEPVRFRSCDVDEDGAVDIFYRSRSGRIRRLEPTGPLDDWLTLELVRHEPGARVELTVRDGDWVLHPVSAFFDLDARTTLGLGPADIVERIAVFPPGGDEPVRTLEKVEPNRELVIELPARKEPSPPPEETTAAADEAP